MGLDVVVWSMGAEGDQQKHISQQLMNIYHTTDEAKENNTIKFIEEIDETKSPFCLKARNVYGSVGVFAGAVTVLTVSSLRTT